MQLHKRLAAYDDFAKNIVGLFAVGLAMANVDGSISDDKLEDLENFITGISTLSQFLLFLWAKGTSWKRISKLITDLMLNNILFTYRPRGIPLGL